MLDFLELEETVGRFWHRLVGDTASWPRHPGHGVELADILPVLSVCFRGFGGESTVQIAPARARTSRHRLRWRQGVGLGEEKLAQPGRDHATLMLPPEIDLFPDRDLNLDLYVWLAAYMATMEIEPAAQHDPLRRDLAALARAEETAARVTAAFPGLVPRYARLAAAVLAVRRRAALPSVERQVETRILSMLRRAAGTPDDSLPAIFPHRAPPRYLPMLPVPLWPDAIARMEAAGRGAEDEPARTSEARGPEAERHVATRERPDAYDKDRSPFILNRFEKILAMAEMVRVDRPSDDGGENDPRPPRRSRT